MAYNREQNEYSAPLDPTNRKVARLLPRFYRSDTNKKFVHATLDQLVQPGTVKKVNGFIGRRDSKSTTVNDIFVTAPTPDRENYQLEPAAVIKDNFDTVTFHKDYLDHVNHISVFGGITSNHARLNAQEYYAWDPQIDWDKFVNFQQYYWLPYGPDVINVFGQQKEIQSQFTVTTTDEGDNIAFLFSPDGLTRNPLIKLYRGQTYQFSINAPGHPFSIKTVRTSGSLNRYTNGVVHEDSGSSTEIGVCTFEVPIDAPNVLFYVSENDVNTGGVFQIQDIEENTEINVLEEVIGKKTFTMGNGYPLSNGMKVKFVGNVIPTSYSQGYWYVEGVGSSIKLVADVDLEIISSYSTQKTVLFDDTAFDNLPFDDASAFASQKDYITMNRASRDRNPWSRYNRWFHKDIIQIAAEINNTIAELDQSARAKRPIIEFSAGLKLYNFGTTAKINVDLIDNFTTDVFSTIEGSLGYSVDGVDLADGHRLLVTADTDVRVNGRIFQVKFIDVQVGLGRQKQITLIDTTDSEPVKDETVLIKLGSNQGKMYWFNGSNWKLGQEKTSTNQEILFDIFDEQGDSISDVTKYDGTTFVGTKSFSYSRSSNTPDAELGFGLRYRNINNIGDILFDYNYYKDSFSYKFLEKIVTQSINKFYFKVFDGTTRFVNGWTVGHREDYQRVVRVYKQEFKIAPNGTRTQILNNFLIDVYDNISNLNDLQVNLYINGNLVPKSEYSITDGITYKQVVLSDDVDENDIVTIKCLSKQNKNNNGFYEVPIALQNNPLNEQINEFTLGQVVDHVGSIVANFDQYTGPYPGNGNLRDLGDVSTYGTRFVQHSGPIVNSLLHLGDKTANAMKAIESAMNDYGKFKRNFLLTAEKLGIDAPVDEFVDAILAELNRSKSNTEKYFLSDMVPYRAVKKFEFTVLDADTTTYPISFAFNLNELSNKAVLVYLNNVQLVFDRDYTFNSEGFVIISAPLQENDNIIIAEYENTDGCFIPCTPTKLGLYPKFVPEIYLDDTYLEPQLVIQGHDGSITIAYNDYRDQLLLELEKRIFNNIKCNYDKNLIDLYDIIPGFNRTTEYSRAEYLDILSNKFYQWTTLLDVDIKINDFFDRANPFTFNFNNNTLPNGETSPGYWRGIYRYLLDTDRPHTHPWEALGFSIEPSWWQEVYGPRPYTSDNLILWEDLQEGIIREPNVPLIRIEKFVRPDLLSRIPVDEYGNLLDPLRSNSVFGLIQIDSNTDFVFGDGAPVETAWTRSSYYAFSVLQSLLLMYPNKILGLYLDRSRTKIVLDQFVYADTNLRLNLKHVVLPSTSFSNTRVFTSGIINYVVDYLTGPSNKPYSNYENNLSKLSCFLTSKLGGFTTKEKFRLLLDSKSPSASSNVFVPSENYDIFLNTNSPIAKITYSGVIVQKFEDGYEIRGYSYLEPYFDYYQPVGPGRVTNIGGITESFVSFAPNQIYRVGSIVEFNNKYYRCIVSHTSTDSFDQSKFTTLPSLPLTGGKDIVVRNKFDTTLSRLPYGTRFSDYQDVVNFLLGYEQHLKTLGFKFDEFDTEVNQMANWTTSAKEFAFWLTQNWAVGSVICLSPAAKLLALDTNLSMVDSIVDPFYPYLILGSDGTPLSTDFINVNREDGTYVIAPKDQSVGIYSATFYLVQKEHVLILDNVTFFNDVIYDPQPGYRQEKIKVLGYLSNGWDGTVNIPGFIFDEAKLTTWEPYVDYNLGDVVQYKQFFYSAIKYIPGQGEFDAAQWTKLDTRPTKNLIPNWDYKAEQFNDFYDLNTDNFDTNQQKIAQHLIGYQKREYLESIIKDDVSQYKFYQGMIIEKGTQNVLNKLFDVLSSNDKESLTLDEEWAVRVGTYGGTAAFDEIELTLDETFFKVNPQPILLTNQSSENQSDFIIRQNADAVYVKPINFNYNLWPINNYYKPLLRSSGYVRYEDVKLNIDSLEDLLTLSPLPTFISGDYIWCAFEGISWNVYRYQAVPAEVDTVTASVTEVTIKFKTQPNLQVGQIIYLSNTDKLSIFYKITRILGSNVYVTNTSKEVNVVIDGVAQVFYFARWRVDDFDNANEFLPSSLKRKELLWSDKQGNDKWAVWENDPVYTSKEFEQAFPGANNQFGTAFTVNQRGDKAVVSDANNNVKIFELDPSNIWLPKQAISPLTGIASNSGSFGKSMCLSPDNEWLFVAEPQASNVKTRYRGKLTVGEIYNEGDIVTVNYVHWRALHTVGADSTTITEFSEDWEQIRLIEADTASTPSTLTNQGMVYIYRKDSASNYILNHVIVSPYPTNNEQFGSKIKIVANNGEYLAAISSAGFNNNQGRIYFYRYSSVSEVSGFEWHMDYNRAFTGKHVAGKTYIAGDIVFYDQKLYKALTDVPVDPFENNPSLWQEIDNFNVQCFIPKDIVLNEDENVTDDDSSFILQSQTAESVLQGSRFGYDFDLNIDGSKLVVSAPYGDDINIDRYKGAFRSDMSYIKGDVVTYQNVYYVFEGPYSDSEYEMEDSALREDSTIPMFTIEEWNPARWSPLDTQINRGKVFVYEYNDSEFVLQDIISGRNFDLNQELRLGESLTLSDNGKYLAISGAFYTGDLLSQGAVFVCQQDSNSFTLYQTITRNQAEEFEKFGHKVRFLNNDKSLVIFSRNGDSNIKTTFDQGLLSFDNNTVTFVDTFLDSGRIDIYDRYINNYIFAEMLDTYVTVINDNYGDDIQTTDNQVFASAPFAAYDEVNQSGTILIYSKPSETYSWNKKSEQIDYVNLEQIKKIYLYNTKTNELIQYLDCIDPILGKIPGIADQEIKYKTYFDPAVYTIGDITVNVDEGSNWTDKFVGTLWWDLSTAKFLEPNDSNVVYRNTVWNKLYETASIDIYEWVKSKYTPSQWNTLADTDEGLAQGISGQARYGNTVVSEKRRFDTQTKTFKKTYYFWVKNKTTIPNVEGRKISAASISSLIADPKSQGYRFAAFTATDSISLYNCKDLLDDGNVKINVQYWITNQDKVNVHSQWKIIRQDADTVLPKQIENKFIDSLVGKDKNDRVVPDIGLPVKKKYGVEFRPRQSMFVYRYEALKQVLERVNKILANILVVDDFDLTDLSDKEEIPTPASGTFDKIIDSQEELRFISTSILKSATLQPIIKDGKIIGANITDPGVGYSNAPYVTIKGKGINAQVKCVIDAQGRVTGVTVINSGEGYGPTTTMTIRPYSVLVLSDSAALNRWSVYSYDSVGKRWSRTKSQSYNVLDFWHYIDWYNAGYNQFTKIDYSVDYTYQVPLIQTEIGNIVKVNQVGTGGWLLLEKYANVNSIDYTQSFKVVGRQNGTIEFNDSLYRLTGSILTFDGGLYDNGSYDNSASKELRIILETLKNKIFVDNLRQYWLDTVFVGFRYALSEQTYLDWLFKTSFIKATHNAGELKQKVNYNSDSLDSYESYINEVKPYHTKVREYVSSYNKIDPASTLVTDFDLPQKINEQGKIVPLSVKYFDNQIVTSDTEVVEYPWKNWYDNVGFKIKSIVISDGGSGYITPPVVRITGNGTGATAQAFIANGRVNRIQLITQGTNYLSAPTIILDGGLQTNGVQAKASAIIESEVVRSMHVSVKFDRTTNNYYITELQEIETFTGSGSLRQFILKWPADIKVGKSTVKVAGQEVLREKYSLQIKSTVTRGYTSYYSVLTLEDAPKQSQVVEITYNKDISLLNAIDRVQHFYNPTTGQLGTNINQLFNGIDYGGVSVTGLGFGSGAGWDALPWFSDQWDGFDAAFDDYIKVVGNDSAAHYVHTLPYVPEAGTILNVYVNGRRIDDPYYNFYDGSTVQPNGRKIAPDQAVMQTIIADGTTDTFYLPNPSDPVYLDINDGDKIIFRRSTSDGSFLPDENEYDTILTGGNLAYSTATGVAPEDIIVDGDDFVSPTTSHGPEELVPGQILDTVAIKVFAIPKDGSAKIQWKNYKGDGIQTAFSIGQFPNSQAAILVTVNGIIKDLNIDYTIDWSNNNVVLLTVPPVDEEVSVASWTFNGEGILDLDYFVGDGSTLEFVTNATWTDNCRSVVLVNGQLLNYDLFQTDITYESAYRVGIRFVSAPPSGSIVNYLIQKQFLEDDSTEFTKTSVVKKEEIITDGSSLAYDLTNQLGYAEMYESNVVVRVAQRILRAPSTEYFTLSNNDLEYSLPQHKFAPYSFAPENLRVYLNGQRLRVGSDYIFDFSDVKVQLTASQYVEGSKLAVVVDVNAEYNITNNIFELINTDSTLWPAGTVVEITSFFNHDILDIQRKEEVITPAITLTAGTVDYYDFRRKQRGLFVLDRITLSDDYVWVIKNGTLLSHSIDWRLLADKQTLEVKNVDETDNISIIGFNPNTITEQYGFMQFKDMLNRTVYKRLNKNKQTFIVNNFGQFDVSITVDDASVLDDPNAEGNLPGVIYINGERIEYFSKTGNTLSRLRRGTLGTGTPTVHQSGTKVLNIGSSETIPYKDEYVTETFVAVDSSNIFYLNYTPEVTLGTVDDGSTQYNDWYRSSIPDNFGQCDEIEVFVAGRRLKKTPYQLHDITLHPESPEGDIQFEAEFSVTNNSTAIRLTNPAPDDTKIVVVKKIGKLWNDPNTSLVDSNNNIANFIKAAPGIWPL
jgi:hypothetical protein